MHKHVTLIALLAALKRKDKPFLFADTHAGGGSYLLDSIDRRGDPVAATDALLEKARGSEEPEIAAYAQQVLTLRERAGNPRWYPGSPLLAAAELRSIDRGFFFELDPLEAERLGENLPRGGNARAERADGYDKLRAVLPPRERRALVLVDPPYEFDTDYARVGECVVEALRRLPSAVIAVWYPIKDARDCERWLKALAARVAAPATAFELWIHATDSRVSLNGSGILVLNPPWLFADRARVWQPHLLSLLQSGKLSGSRVEVYKDEIGGSPS